ncbi:RNA polymerase sigma-70 factor (ECF subfamily) [Pedobacter cryoconitis]|uniref:RNA polymerase sigma-70 factor (ECF subfamily) n=1 Tax=Pedobacter cryoconitis TaxID=188932 RepID=A0A7W8ZM85_9SPHI|nr:RNA polymerase sigma-70 factor [Pedobacter cryoconitis]MBB5636614.1 RNA polymerase sigma-70 factor (ECF subfamily) [Pedobacter cryoconitis]MBB6271555.1 RNA polymerase sigma-70 factor (ECF subfamily) [Pedobacter cryoconitis]
MKINEATDGIVTGEDLLNLIEDDDKSAFTIFYSNNFQKLVLVSDRYVKNIHAAEEIVQDMFLKIWEDKGLLLYVNSVKAYLYRSVVNASLNYVNRQKNIEKHHLKIAEHLTDDDIEIINEQNELIVLLYNEIELLPEKCQKVFKLSRLEGLKYRDIAVELSISEKTVENHMSNALRLLRMRVIHNIQTEDPKSKAKYFSLLSLFLY